MSPCDGSASVVVVVALNSSRVVVVALTGSSLVVVVLTTVTGSGGYLSDLNKRLS